MRKVFELVLVMASVAGACAAPSEDIDLAAGADASDEQTLLGLDWTPGLASLLAADRAASRVSSSRGLVEGFGSLFTDDALFLAWRERILLGPDAIRAHLAATPDAAQTSVSWVTACGDVAADGRLGYTFGWRTQSTTLADGTVNRLYGKYIAVWERQPTGPWKIRGYDFFQHPLEPVSPQPPEWLRHFCKAGRAGARSVQAEADLAELFATDSAFSAESAASGTQAAFHDYAAPYAATIPAVEPINFNREAIAAANQQAPGSPSLTWEPRAGDIAASNDLGFTVGYYTVNAPTPFYGKYLTVWQRQYDTKWQFVVDGGSSVRGAIPPTGL